MCRPTQTLRLVSATVLVALLSGSACAAQETKETPKIPPVVLSKQHAALCKVKVGDTLPVIELPRLEGGRATPLANLFGEKATVVVFWTANRRMAREQLTDIEADVIKPYARQGVAVVGVAVNESASTAQAVLQKARVTFPNLLDARGQAFAAVGGEKLPRTYLVGPQGKILWFDIEYSHATRRELRRALRAVAGEPASAGR
jgi:peroxiredoxin